MTLNTLLIYPDPAARLASTVPPLKLSLSSVDASTTGFELSALLTAYFTSPSVVASATTSGGEEAASTSPTAAGEEAGPIVALQDSDNVIYPFSTVIARPDVVANKKLYALRRLPRSTLFLNELCERNLLSEKEVEILQEDNPYVVAALEVYEAERDLDDLIDTLQRIVAIRQQQRRPTTTTSSSVISPSSTTGQSEEENASSASLSLLEELTSALRLPEFPEAGILAVLSELRGANILGHEDVVALRALASKHHPYLQAAYEVFLEDSNPESLVRSFRRVAKRFGFAKVAREFPTALYGKVLFEAFEAGEPRVCAAWDVFVDEYDREDFRDSLLRCYRRIFVGMEAMEIKNLLRRCVIGLHAQGSVDDERGAKLMALVDGGFYPDSLAKAAKRYLEEGKKSRRDEKDAQELGRAVLALLNEEEEEGGEYPNDDDDDDDAEAEGRRREAARPEPEDEMVDAILAEGRDVSREGATRSERGTEEEADEEKRVTLALKMFVRHLKEVGKLKSSRAIRKLDSLIMARDPRLMGAFDSFMQDHDEDDLADTLGKLADKVSLLTPQGGIEGGEEEGVQRVDDDYFSDEDEEEDEENETGPKTFRDFLSKNNGDDSKSFGESVMTRFLKDLDLPRNQLEALKHALDTRDPALVKAIDQFHLDNNVKAFRADLLAIVNGTQPQRVASDKVKPVASTSSAAAQGGGGDAANGGDASGGDEKALVERLIASGRITRAQVAKIKRLDMKEMVDAWRDGGGDDETFVETVHRLGA